MTNDTPEIRLTALKTPEDIRECHENNFVAWGQNLTLDQYLKREKIFGSQPSTKDGNLTYWALQEQTPDNQNQWKTVCSMETLRRPAYYKEKGSPIVDTWSHCIGSVFTPVANRGRGYATKMLQKGSETLDHWQMDQKEQPTSFSALWSDVGNYYSKFGYHTTDVHELKFSFDYSASAGTVEWPQDVQPIGYNDIDDLAERDLQQLRHIMERDTEKDGIPRVAIKPEAMVHHTTFERAIYLSQHMGKTSTEPPVVFGAKHNDCWMLWTQDFSGDKLVSLRVFADVNAPKDQVTESFKKLVQAGMHEAQKWKFPYFSVWAQDVPEQLSAEQVLNEFLPASQFPGVSKCEYYERESSWPMVRFYKAEKGLEAMKWVYDGRYGWF